MRTLRHLAERIARWAHGLLAEITPSTPCEVPLVVSPRPRRPPPSAGARRFP